MSDTKLIVTKDKLDKLATSISTKSGVATPMTIAQMKVAVDGISGGTITQDEDGYIVISEDGFQAIDYLSLRASNTLCEEYENDNITILKIAYFIEGWSNLKKLSLPNCTSFQKSFALGTNTSTSLIVYLPKLQTLSGQCFQSFKCANMTLPSVTGITNYCFYSSTIPIIDLGVNCVSIGGSHSLDGNVSVLIMRSPSVVSLSNINSFPPATFGSNGTGGTLYVPSALISSYQSATNWSTILGYTNNQILPIEGSIYETQYADGTPISS